MNALQMAYWRIAATLDDLRGWRTRRAVRRAGLYPAYVDWIGEFALDRSGTVLFAEHPADWRRAEPVREPELIHVARAQAARRTRDAQRFAPIRGPDAQPCPSCGGSGQPNVPVRHRHRILCECGGTGWVPAGWRSSHTRAGHWVEHGLDRPQT